MQDIQIKNIVATSSISNKLNLYLLNEILPNTKYDPNKFPGLIYHQKSPKTSLLLFKSGKVVCTGGNKIKDVEKAISNIIKLLSKYNLFYYNNPKVIVQNIVATYNLYTKLELANLSIFLGFENVEYEPEQFPGLVHRIMNPKMTFLIFNTGKVICIGAKKIEEVYKAIKYLKTVIFK